MTLTVRRRSSERISSAWRGKKRHLGTRDSFGTLRLRYDTPLNNVKPGELRLSKCERAIRPTMTWGS
jgi:hypothetical protein